MNETIKSYFAVTGILMHKDRILILKKSPKDYNYPNKWSFCSGYVKEFEAGEETALREIKEETGLDAKIESKGKIVETIDKNINTRWVIMMFVCSTNSENVKLDHENTEYRWIRYDEMDKFDFVPGLNANLKAAGIFKENI